MKIDRKQLLLLVGMGLCFGCTSQGSSKVLVYAGEAKLGNDQRTVTIEIDPEDLKNSRWTIAESGRHRIPFLNPEWDELNRRFQGELTFFGNHSFGSVDVKISEDPFAGKLTWHGDSVNVPFSRSALKLTYVEENVSFRNGNVQLSGTLILPKSGRKHPLVVFAHGSGNATRWWGMYWAKELSRIGIASLLYDKRGCGDSFGKSWTRSSLDDLANDVIAGMISLEDHPRIDKDKIGIYGVSQGGWISGRVASLYDNLSFIIVNSGGGISPYEEEVFSYDLSMKYQGIDSIGVQEGNALVRKYMDYMSTGKGRKAFEKEMEVNKEKSWYPILGLERVVVAESNRKNWEWIANYEPSEDLIKIEIPVLVMFGDQDYQQPTEASAKAWKDALAAAGNCCYTIKVFEGAGHGLTIGGHHGKGFPKYAKGHIELMKNFIKEFVVGD